VVFDHGGVRSNHGFCLAVVLQSVDRREGQFLGLEELVSTLALDHGDGLALFHSAFAMLGVVYDVFGDAFLEDSLCGGDRY
jgi:hypothetical protein